MLSLEARTCADLVYIGDIIDAATASVQLLAASNGIVIQTSVPDYLPAIQGDSKRIQRAVTHLLDNAVKFNKSGGEVHVHLSEDAGNLNLVIEDTGIGMSDQQRARTGELFSKDEHVLSRRHEGSGLGLSYVARVAALHNAPVNISERVGGGTIVCVAFRKVAADKTAEVA
jgi:cell cycle sensor histidine kinase DivJ